MAWWRWCLGVSNMLLGGGDGLRLSEEIPLFSRRQSHRDQRVPSDRVSRWGSEKLPGMETQMNRAGQTDVWEFHWAWRGYWFARLSLTAVLVGEDLD